jgi:hypothetical protein
MRRRFEREGYRKPNSTIEGILSQELRARLRSVLSPRDALHITEGIGSRGGRLRGLAKRTGDDIPGVRRDCANQTSRPPPNEGPAIGAFSTLAACNGADDQERLLTRGDSFG